MPKHNNLQIGKFGIVREREHGYGAVTSGFDLWYVKSQVVYYRTHWEAGCWDPIRKMYDAVEPKLLTYVREFTEEEKATLVEMFMRFYEP